MLKCYTSGLVNFLEQSSESDGGNANKTDKIVNTCHVCGHYTVNRTKNLRLREGL